LYKLGVIVSDDILTLPAKEAIRGYMLKLVTLPAILLAAFSFFIGFLVKDVAMATAKSEAQSLYTGEIASIMSSADRATDAATAAQTAAASAEAASGAAATILNGQFAEFAKLIVTDDTVQNSLKAMLSQEASKLNAVLGDIKALRVRHVFEETEAARINDSNAKLTVSCPPDLPNVVGGGFEVVSGDLVAIHSVPRHPIEDFQAGWEVIVKDRGSSGGTKKFFAHAVCSNIQLSGT
jgi:hypothetical protein